MKRFTGGPSLLYSLSCQANSRLHKTEKNMSRATNFITVFLMNSAVFAASLSYEGFDYETGDLAGNGGGIGFTGNWSVTTGSWNVAADSLSYSTLETTGNKVVAQTSGTNIAARSTGVQSDSGEFWASILVDSLSWNGGGLTFSANTSNLNLNAADFDNRARFGFGINGSDYVYTLDGRTGAPVNGSVAGAPVGTVFLVAKFDVTNGLFSMWANPDLDGSSPAGGTLIADNVSFTRTGADFANDIQVAGLFTNWSGVGLDEVRLGTDFTSVAIPEPSTLALLGIAGLCAGLFARRRR
ncbi:MAG: PEP-CTERM sorting domain-containing protein [Verrucomicrobia bacterium]|nr:PEP-CTERM sorting domain-containing protein [Verrucomicrobiota bacterium]